MPIIKEEKLHKNLKSFESVKKEVEASKYADWKHATVDAAKKRAIYSSGSYKEFQDIVATCGLNPIGRNEFSRPARQQTHNRALTGKESRPGEALSVRGDVGKAPKIKAVDFERNLRRAKTDSERVQLFSEMGPGQVVEALRGSERGGEYVDAEVLLYVMDTIRSAVEADGDGDGGGKVLKGIIEGLLGDVTVIRTMNRFLTAEERDRMHDTCVKAGVDPPIHGVACSD